MAVDAHRLLSDSSCLESGDVGYDRYKQFPELFYVFSLAEGLTRPEFYMQYEGPIPSSEAYSALLRECGLDEKACMLFIEGDESLLSPLSSMRLLKRGDPDVKEQIPPSQFEYEHAFLYQGRPVFSKRIDYEGYTVHLYLDSSLLTEEYADLLSRLEKEHATKVIQKHRELALREKSEGRLTDEELSALRPRTLSEEATVRLEIGTFALRTSQLELDSEQVYTIYKQRDAIDQLFTRFTCSFDLDATYMRGDYCEEGWLFLNHLSMMMGHDAIATLALTEDITLDDFIQGMGKIQATKLEGKWCQAEVPKGVGSMCSLLGIELSPIGELIP